MEAGAEREEVGWVVALRRAQRRSRRHAIARYAQLATVEAGAPRCRTVVVRGVDAERGAVWFVTDGRSAKAAQLLSVLEDPALAIVLVEAFLSRPEGPELLSKALQESRMKEPVALAANRIASASGRNVPELLAALNKAGGLKPVSSSMSPQDRSKLIIRREYGIFNRFIPYFYTS